MADRWAGWEIRLSTSRGVPYFFNTEAKKSTWEPPEDMTEEEIKQLPGAKEYLKGEGVQGGVHAGQVRASHLLVKHRDSRRPSSWKESVITRSKEDAIELLKEFQAEIDGDPQKFAEVASQESHCSSHSHGGDLGWFGRGQMQKPFEDATFALEVGKISDIISTESGVHLILRTG
ncbi:rotamase-domain-containing protein [Coprinopsis marcescibilis]|uniref:Peptidyl-prolyl cis-trans isomerase n=1 Tax=Coprinopsis marcescibilis TaxID=230819 RepID=A0A5C3L173_COPMA|nr:rotamase-domain-containing protein [Coprinopsis marcescibilis]